MNKKTFGLIGTISRDEVRREGGAEFRNLGGALYQAAVLCGLGEETRLHARLADDMAAEVTELVGGWKTFRRDGLAGFHGAGNWVSLHYPARGERVEILHSAVPALEPEPIIAGLPGLCFLVMIINSGFDMELEDWRRVADAAVCPVWLDFHSLALEKTIGRPRAYRAVPEWRDWARGAAYLQANRKEVSCLLGRPEGEAGPEDTRRFSRQALDGGASAVFVTLGKEGALVSTPRWERFVSPPASADVVDTTGCGDVFCAAACSALSRGASPEEAARFGVSLASAAAGTAGVGETFGLARNFRHR
jgi:hypothetical protein